jgi:hypothetical protein
MGVKKKRNFIKNKFENRKLEKGGWSVPRAPVIFLLLSNTLKMIERCMICGD